MKVTHIHFCTDDDEGEGRAGSQDDDAHPPHHVYSEHEEDEGQLWTIKETEVPDQSLETRVPFLEIKQEFVILLENQTQFLV